MNPARGGLLPPWGKVGKGVLIIKMVIFHEGLGPLLPEGSIILPTLKIDCLTLISGLNMSK
jgi:hypothetical protein